MAEYFELPKDFQGFVTIDGEKVFVVETRCTSFETVDVPFIKDVSKGRLLKRGVYDYKLRYVKDFENRWFNSFLAINAKGVLRWYFVNAKCEMIDGSDLWTEFVKACREQKYKIDPEDGANLNGFSDRVRRVPTEIVKGQTCEGRDYYLSQVFHNVKVSAEEKASLRAFLHPSIIEAYDRGQHMDALMEKSCEREGSAKFTFGT